MNPSYRFLVGGHVQGVFFRQSTAERAQALGLSGWVRNLDDGRVEGVASGAPQALAALRAWLEHGPERATVTSLEWRPDAETENPASEAGFMIRR